MSKSPAPSASRSSSERGAAGAGVRRWLLQPEAPALIFLVVLVVGFSLATDAFLSSSNLESILTATAVLGVIALAVNQVVLCGEIDISTGSMLGLCAMAAGTVAVSQGGVVLPFLTAVAVGTAAGAVNGVLVTIGRIPAIIVTLGMLYALRGVLLLFTGGTWVSGIPSGSRVLGTGTLLGINVPIIMLALLFVTLWAVNKYTVWGRNVAAVGGNRRASRLAGLSVDRVRFLSFVLVGVFVGIASMIYIGRTGGVQTNAGFGLELQVIAAIVVGGTSITGGRGSALAALTGAVLIGVILNGMILIGVPNIWQDAVLGGLILLAVTVDYLRRRFLEDKS